MMPAARRWLGFLLRWLGFLLRWLGLDVRCQRNRRRIYLMRRKLILFAIGRSHRLAAALHLHWRVRNGRYRRAVPELGEAGGTPLRSLGDKPIPDPL